MLQIASEPLADPDSPVLKNIVVSALNEYLYPERNKTIDTESSLEALGLLDSQEKIGYSGTLKEHFSAAGYSVEKDELAKSVLFGMADPSTTVHQFITYTRQDLSCFLQ